MNQDSFFDGDTYEPLQDKERLETLFERVKSTMAGAQWWTLEELAAQAKGSQASVSARIRDLRKERFGGWEIVRRRLQSAPESGVWEYQMTGQHVVPTTEQPAVPTTEQPAIPKSVLAGKAPRGTVEQELKEAKRLLHAMLEISTPYASSLQQTNTRQEVRQFLSNASTPFQTMRGH